MVSLQRDPTFTENLIQHFGFISISQGLSIIILDEAEVATGM